MYKFSAPLPYTIEDINKLLDINKEAKKSKITSLYACVPRGCEVFTGFEQSRNFQFNYIKWDYWKRLINQTIDLNCDFIYLLNSPKPLDIDNPDFLQQLEKLDLLLNELCKIGVKKLRVASAQLMTYIANHYSDFEILASTSLEYKTIWEYQNFIEFHPEIKQIVPSHDVNKNFKLLSHLRRRYKNIELELIVNEGCMQGCPNRILHESISIDNRTKINNDIYLSNSYSGIFCNSVAKKYPIPSLIMGTYILPWEIDEYKKIGITNFKLVGRDRFHLNFQYYLDSYFKYLKCIDNVKNAELCKFTDFIHHFNNNNFLDKFFVKDYLKYFPKIKYFVKYGHLCASSCGEECRYCYKCAEKIQKVFVYKQKELLKRNISVCTINK